MTKSILTAVAAGAIALCGAASAQNPGAEPGTLLGHGAPVYGNPLVVNGVPYQSVYIDRYGRQVGIDQNGNHVVLQASNYGRCGIVGHDVAGNPIFGPTRYGGYACPGGRLVPEQR